MNITPLTENIIQLYSAGKSKKDIAFELGLSSSEVTRVLSKPEVQKMVEEIIKTTGDAIVAKNLGIIEDIIADKLAIIKNNPDKSLADATNKDVVDLMNIVNSMMVQRDKLKQEQDGNTYIQILNGILS